MMTTTTATAGGIAAANNSQQPPQLQPQLVSDGWLEAVLSSGRHVPESRYSLNHLLQPAGGAVHASGGGSGRGASAAAAAGASTFAAASAAAAAAASQLALLTAAAAAAGSAPAAQAAVLRQMPVLLNLPDAPLGRWVGVECSVRWQAMHSECNVHHSVPAAAEQTSLTDTMCAGHSVC
jgi:hypothetical protein